MKIKFEENRDNGTLTYFAIAENELYNKRIHEELMFCELVPSVENVKIVWEDVYNKPDFCDDLGSARNFVLDNYQNHKPFSNGRNWTVEEFNK